MRKQTVRIGLKFSLLPNALFFAALLLDYYGNASAWMVPLLILYAAFVVAVVILFVARPRPKPAPVADPRPIGDDPVRVAIAERP